MKIAFPTQENKGAESIVYSHFGSAQFFITVDEDTREMEVVDNKDINHIHGKCQPIAALDGRIVDAVVVGGIGAGALLKLNGSGIKVFRAIEGTVSENLELIKSGNLPQFQMNQTCIGHSKNGGCAH